MEGPSLKIACEEFAPFLGKRIRFLGGSSPIAQLPLVGKVFRSAESWGKHLHLRFGNYRFRIHFLMFGSYRIDDPRKNRFPKLEIEIGGSRLYFYSCAIKSVEESVEELSDVTADLMSDKWSAAKAMKKLDGKAEAQVADVLMDQDIFAGLGNIIKNEVLFRLRMHPETRVEQLTKARRQALVKDAHRYSWQFYEWKKANVLKRNWRIFRKKKCPDCGGAVKKRPTGKLERLSHYCSHCQKKK